MEELKKLFNKELDPDIQDQKKEAKKVKGFIPEGIKIFSYIAKNYVEVYEVESAIEYGMEYLNLFRIIEVLGFNEDKVELSKGKILNGYYTIFDFDNKSIMFYDLDHNFKPLGGFLTEGKEKHDGVFGDEVIDETDYDTETFSKWYNYINKI